MNKIHSHNGNNGNNGNKGKYFFIISNLYIVF
jgi:hypothetical protein